MEIENLSKTMSNAINELAKLPGIGERTATRLVMYLIRQDKQYLKKLSESIDQLSTNLYLCNQCHNVSDTEICNICSDDTRDYSKLCIVQNIQDLIAIERSRVYNGYYHVLNGLISPLDGITPDKIYINDIPQRLQNSEINEIIFALPATVEGDTTAYYIFNMLKDFDSLYFSAIARGISIGGNLEYIDELTLGKAIKNRIDFSNAIKK
ncbi:MAG TPA: recombination mediator RecR [Bacteroidales bacterium]|nr:recombination mediator RecR [Bacteroidales bacterium]HRT72401.1 recombination mediator RecR [Bacteroidales bacterium]